MLILTLVRLKLNLMAVKPIFPRLKQPVNRVPYAVEVLAFNDNGGITVRLLHRLNIPENVVPLDVL